MQSTGSTGPLGEQLNAAAEPLLKVPVIVGEVWQIADVCASELLASA